jgi:hypothetical protein
MRLSLMSTVYQSAEDVIHYAEIESASSGGGENRTSEQYEDQSSEGRAHCTVYQVAKEIHDYC